MSVSDGQANMDFTYGRHRYNLVHIPGTSRVRVYYRVEGTDEWIFGHGKTIPEGMSVAEAAKIIASYLTEGIDWEEYNQLLPGV